MPDRPKILVVDDAIDIIRAMSVRLEAAGYQVLSAPNGESGLKLALEAIPDAIVLDMRMPGMDGHTMLARLRGDAELATIPIIVVSANTSEQDQKQARQAGARYVLEKPYDAATLIRAVRLALGEDGPRPRELHRIEGRNQMSKPGNVLIAGSNREATRSLAARCRKIGLEAHTTSIGGIAVLKARKSPPDLMIVDVTRAETDGFMLCERLNEIGVTFPVVVQLVASDPEAIRRCDALGMHFVVNDGGAWARLEALISQLLHAGDLAWPMETDAPARPEAAKNGRAEPKVLVVDDDAGVTKAIGVRLRYHGINTLEASSGLEGYRVALKELPDVIVTDYKMPAGSGDHLMVRLAENPATRTIPVIVVTGQTLGGRQDVALRRDLLGRCRATAFLTKPVDFNMLLEELRRHITIREIATPGANVV
jgi:CheY-like chemotaxis protein